MNPAPAHPLIKVMIIEDHKTMLWGLQRLLEGEHTGMEVVATADTLDDGLERLAHCVPDVVLLDLDLNGLSSLPLLPALLANEHTRVLLFTSSRDRELLDQAVVHGVRGILHKDAAPEVLLKAITKVHDGELWLEQNTLSRVFEEFTRRHVPRRTDPELAKQAALTTRERKIIDAIVSGSGALNKSLAQSLFISEHTLRNHLVSIYKKLQVSNRLELYVYAVKHHLTADSAPPPQA